MKKYDVENEELEYLEKERAYIPICTTCPSRLYVSKSIKEQKCRRCVEKEYKSSPAYLAKLINDATLYPDFESTGEALNYLGLR